MYTNLRDRLGSTVGLTNGNGTLAATHAYDAFGKARDANLIERPNGTLDLLVNTLRGFTGHEHVDDLRVIHMNGRLFDYQLGRFLGVDPVVQFPSDSQSLNPYSYLRNNPFAGKDPSGYFECDERGTCKGTVSEIESVARYKDGTVTATNKDGQTITLGNISDKGVQQAVGAFVIDAWNGANKVQGSQVEPSRSPDSIESVASRFDAQLSGQGPGRTGDVASGAVNAFANRISGGLATFLAERLDILDPEEAEADAKAFEEKYGWIGALANLNPKGIVKRAENIIEKSGAESAKQGADLARHLRYIQKYGSNDTKYLENGRVRYYGNMKPADKIGEMAGRRYVHEFDPSTGKSRGWHETLDHSDRVRQVRPQISGPKEHYRFDADGQYNGRW